jgi:hypothetical protein
VPIPGIGDSKGIATRTEPMLQADDSYPMAMRCRLRAPKRTYPPMFTIQPIVMWAVLIPSWIVGSIYWALKWPEFWRWVAATLFEP